MSQKSIFKQLKDLSVGKQEETDGLSSCTIELWEDKSLELSASPSLKLQVQDIHAKQAWVRDIREAKKKLGKLFKIHMTG